MCQGTFDIVHPGHLRHLLYAKAKADILIVNLYTDSWLERHPEEKFNQPKAPHVPQDQRAIGVAAIEAVDHVCFEDEDSLNLFELKPDFFAIGYDYIFKKVSIEPYKQVVESYGGHIIFTPQN